MIDFYALVFSFVTGLWALEFILQLRQHRCFDARELTPELRGKIAQETFDKSQRYGKAKSWFALVSSVFDLAFSLSVLHFGLISATWTLAGRLNERYLAVDASYEILRSLTFCCIAQGVSALFQLPFSLYSTFVIEERFGFNKQTLRLFFVDLAKMIVLQIALGLPVVALLLTVIKWGGDNFWFYAWILIFVLVLVFLTIFPFIQALFNKFTELELGELRDGIEALARRVDFPLTKIYQVDGSKRSSHSNAYFYGFFKNKRVVLFDTLVKQVDVKGVIAVIGHEFGHYKLNHVLQNIVVVQAHMLAFMWLFGQALTNAELFRAFGFNSRPALIGLVLFSFLYGPFEHLFGFAMHVLSRHFEYQADEFAVRLGLDLDEPLTKIHEENLACLNPDPWFSAYHYSHPTLVERLRTMNALKRELAAKSK